MVHIFTDFFYLCQTLHKLIVWLACNLTEWWQNSKIILQGSTEFILSLYVEKHPRSNNLSVSKARQNKMLLPKSLNAAWSSGLTAPGHSGGREEQVKLPGERAVGLDGGMRKAASLQFGAG